MTIWLAAVWLGEPIGWRTLMTLGALLILANRDVVTAQWHWPRRSVRS
jgi:hypothetical protein